MENKENKKLNKILKIIAVCVIIIAFSIYTSYQESVKNYSLAIKASSEGNYQKAEEYYKTAINGTLGLNPSPLLGLGKLYSMQGKYSKAEPLFKKSLAICEKRYKPNDIQTIDSLYTLANLYSITGQYKEAEQLLERALESVGNEDLNSKIKLLEALGETYFSATDYKNSEKYLLKALDLKNNLYQKDSPELVKNYIELLRIYSVTNKAKEEQILKQTIKTCESTNKCEDDQLISLYMSSIILYMDKKDLVHSKFYADKALKKYNNISIENIHKPIEKISYLLNMHTINYAKGNKNKAIVFLNQALKLATELDDKSIIKTIQEIRKMEVK